LHDKDKLASDALPHMICLENVVGFAESNSCRRWRRALAQRGYAVAHFHWTPPQVGLPNDRPRYFCLAVLQDKLRIPNPKFQGIVSVEKDCEADPVIQTSLNVLNVVDESTIDASTLPPIRDFLEPDDTHSHDLTVPDKLLACNSSWCFDIVTPDTHRSSCFTSGYGKFIKGTGSVLYQGPSTHDFSLQRPEERSFEADWASHLEAGSLRYLSGLEIARLMGFPATFSFPGSCSSKQEWKLVGNSINVRLAARLIQLGLILMGKA
jgi:tRNA (cytosine38-C5)-methyltransferase